MRKMVNATTIRDGYKVITHVRVHIYKYMLHTMCFYTWDFILVLFPAFFFLCNNQRKKKKKNNTMTISYVFLYEKHIVSNDIEVTIAKRITHTFYYLFSPF